MGVEASKTIHDAVMETKDLCLPLRYTSSTHDIAEVIGLDVYPKIKHLLPKAEDGEPEWDETRKIQELAEYIKGLPMGSSKKEDKAQFFDAFPEIRPFIKKTEQALKKILKNKQFDRYEGQYYTGKLVNRKIWKVGSQNFRVFAKRVAPKTEHYHFSLVVDESGSMYGGKIKMAVRSAMLFHCALARLHITHAVYGFNAGIRTYYTGMNEMQEKERNKIFPQMVENSTLQIDHELDAGYNSDGYALEHVAEAVPKDATKKVIFMISDGLPEPIWDRNIARYDLRKMVQKYESLGYIVVGIGIGNGEDVAEYYKTHVRVPDISELPKTIEQQLATYMK